MYGEIRISRICLTMQLHHGDNANSMVVPDVCLSLIFEKQENETPVVMDAYSPPSIMAFLNTLSE